MSSKPVRKLAAMQRPAPRLRLRQGVVEVDNADGTIDLTLGGDDVVIESVQVIAGTTVTVGATVWVLQQGPLLLALGSNAT